MFAMDAGKRLVTIPDVAAVARDRVPVQLDASLIAQIEKSRAVVEKHIREKRVVYGITTGFGKLSDTFIEPEKNQELQKNLLLSHAVGVGEPFPEEVVRAMLFLRLHSLAKGFSGVRPVVLDYLARFLNDSVAPIVPSQGSVGASGDLAPLAHLALPLIGVSDVFFRQKKMSAKEALSALGLAPLELQAKEGLGLINGTQAMTAVAALSLHDASFLLRTAEIAAAMSLEATLSSDSFLDERLHALRPHAGQIRTAKRLKDLISGSPLVASHKNSLHRIQDGYSIRCAPQVHGAVHDALLYAKRVIETEINSVTDNPLVFAKEEQILSGGNFHGHPIALAIDFLKIAIAGLSNISERRIERLVNPELSGGLPPFLSVESGIHSGMMILQYTAAALVSENKTLSHPASVDSIPTSANQEDYNSMGTIAARQLARIVENASFVVGIELLCAAQALEFRRPLGFGPGVEEAYRLIRENVPMLRKDRFMKEDLDRAASLVKSGELAACVDERVKSCGA